MLNFYLRQWGQAHRLTPTFIIEPFLRVSKKPRRVFCECRKESQTAFLAAACTWTKTLLRLQVWNLSAIGRQIMRAADCKILAEKPGGVFRQAQAPQSEDCGAVLLCFNRIGQILPTGIFVLVRKASRMASRFSSWVKRNAFSLPS